MSKYSSYWMSDDKYKLVTKLTPIPTINLVILRGDRKDLEILLIIRKTGYAKGRWCIIGGRVSIGESLKQAINRHAADLAVKVKIIDPFAPNFPAYIDDRNTQDKTKYLISMIYPAQIVSGRIREEGKEYEGYRWFSVKKFPYIAYGQKLQIKKT